MDIAKGIQGGAPDSRRKKMNAWPGSHRYSRKGSPDPRDAKLPQATTCRRGSTTTVKSRIGRWLLDKHTGELALTTCWCGWGRIWFTIDSAVKGLRGMLAQRKGTRFHIAEF